MLKDKLCERFWIDGQAGDEVRLLARMQFVLIDDLRTITSDEIERLENEVDEHERHSADQP